MTTRLPLLAVLLCACTPTAVERGSDGGEVGVPFADLGGLQDGTVVREDATEVLPDAARLNDAGEVCRTGSTSGVVCAPDGTVIAGARVTAVTRDCEGRRTLVEAEADADGRFRLEGLSPGAAEVTISSGSFLGRFEVEIIAGINVPASGGISDKVCLESRAARLAVLSGDFDRIQTVLGALGFEYDLYCGESWNHRSGRQLLSDWEALSAYDIVFFNCASGIDFRNTNPEVEVIRENLRRFVAVGGSIYASDLAGDVIFQLWPDDIRFTLGGRAPSEAPGCCVCTNCRLDCEVSPDEPRGCSTCCDEPNVMPVPCRTGAGVHGGGEAGEVRATLAADFLQLAVGRAQVPVIFNLGGWVQIAATAPHVEILVRDAAGLPLMVLYQPAPDSGRIAFTSFHVHAQATEPMTRILAALVLRL